MGSFKNRRKILQDEVIDKKGQRIYLEKKISDVIKTRYDESEIKLDSSYIYQKMKKLVDRKIYLRTWNISRYVHDQGFINIFELHKKLEDMIRICHLPKRQQKIYTRVEKDYMKEFMKKRGLREDRGLLVDSF